MKKDFTNSIVFIILLLTGCSKAAAQFTFRHLGVEDGLSQSTVFSTYQDKQGLLWFGTLDGLNKYDGTRFEHFKYDPSDSNTLPAPVILCIIETDDEKLLIGTDGGGLSVFDKKTQRFINYKNNPADSNSISSNRVTSICRSDKNLYWISTFYGGLNLFNKSTGKFSSIKSKENDSTSLSSNHISRVIQTSDGMVWLATRKGLNLLDKRTGKITRFLSSLSDLNSIPDNRVQELYEDYQHHIWIGTFNGGICEFDPLTKKFTRYKDKDSLSSTGNNYVNCFTEGPNNSLWIGTNGNGLKLLNRITGNITGFINDPENINSISNNDIYSLFTDKSGILWIGTNGGGINLYQKKYDYFNHYYEPLREHFPNKNIYSIFQDTEGLLWVGTNGGGLNCLRSGSGKFNNYLNDQKQKKSLSNNDVWCIYEDRDKNLWIGTNGGGLNLFDRKSDSFRVFKNDTANKNSISANNVWCMYEDNDALLWIGTQQGGLNIYDRHQNKFLACKKSDSVNSINSNTVFSVAGDNKSEVYIGTQGGGFNIYYKKSKLFKHYNSHGGEKYALNNNDIFCIHPATEDLIWLGTNGGGINVFSKKKQRFLHFTEKDGLPNNVVYGILPDDNGDLWLSTNKGICRFTPPKQLDFDNSTVSTKEKKPVCKNYDVGDGLPSDEFNQGAFFKNHNGYMYFGGVAGLAAFMPDSITANQYQSDVIFTRFKVFEKEFPLDTLITYKQKITLTYDQNFFSFDFASLNYLLPGKNEYAVMMQGFDKDWIYTGTRHYAGYTNLNPGDYVFKVRGSNNDGIWSEKMASIHIVITPPFYLTWWFRLAVVLLFLVAVFSIYKIRVRQIKKEETQKTAFNKSLSEVEMKALRSQMNPHFIFNSLHSINKYMLDNDKQNASEFLSKFSKLMRLILENSREQEVSLENDLHALELYMQLEALRFQNKFQFKIEVGDELDKETTLIPPMILQPFVENSIVHGMRAKENGLIQIKIKKEGNMIKCSVEDNGSGRQEKAKVETGEEKAEEKKHKSLAMKITQERLNIISQLKKVKATISITDLKDDDNKPRGLLVELLLPYENAF